LFSFVAIVSEIEGGFVYIYLKMDRKPALTARKRPHQRRLLLSLLLCLLWAEVASSFVVVDGNSRRRRVCSSSSSKSNPLEQQKVQRCSRRSLPTTAATIRNTDLALEENECNPEDEERRMAARSLAGVRHADVLEGLRGLYPEQDIDKRNALSRTDGYWPFIQKGEEPPKQFTYGEYDLLFFAELLDKVHSCYYSDNSDNNNNKDGDSSTPPPSSWKDCVFLDIGSGAGRLVIGAAALHPDMKLCKGMEILPGLNKEALEIVQKCREDNNNNNNNNANDEEEDDREEEEWIENESGLLVKVAAEAAPPEEEVQRQQDDEIEEDDDDACYSLPIYSAAAEGEVEEKQRQRLSLAPMEFSCSSFEDPYNYFLADANVIFCFSSCMSTDIRKSLSMAIGRECRPGTIVMVRFYFVYFS